MKNLLCLILSISLIYETAFAQAVMVKEIQSGSNGSYIVELINVNGKLFFNANDGAGARLWMSDGTTGGTMKVEDIAPPGPIADPTELTNFNGELFFRATDYNSGDELWWSNGTAATGMIADIYSGYLSGGPNSFTVAQGDLFFAAADPGPGIWKTSGLSAVKITNFSEAPYHLTEGNNLLNAQLLFFKNNSITGDTELWKSDGSDVSTVMIHSGFQSAGNADPITIAGFMFFVAHDGINGIELWRTNGTSGGTVMVKNINTDAYVDWPPAGSSFPVGFIDFNGTLFFSADNGANGHELWKSDGSDAGTVMVKDINGGINDSDPGYFIVYNGEVYFSADNGSDGIELWKSDGSGAGTMIVEDINPGGGSSYPSHFAVYNGKLYFSADNGSNGFELWSYDGTTAKMEVDINIGSGSSSPKHMTELNGVLYFSAADGGNNSELWSYTEALVPSITNFAPTSGPIGTEVTIEGDNLSGATDVQFNGTSTSDFAFDVIGGVTSIRAIVPAGTTTGTISVTTPSGPATSALDFTLSGGLVVTIPQNVTGGNYTNVAVANGGEATFTGNIAVNGDIIVLNGGKAYFQDVTLLGQAIIRPGGYASLKQSCHVLSGSGSFTLKDGATLEICHPDGISSLANTGNIQVTGGKTFSPAANYVYNGDAAQVTGDALPSIVNDLTIDNSAGVTLSQNTTANGVVYIKTNASLDTDGKLTLASGASLMHGTGTPGGNEGTLSSDLITAKRTGHSSPLKWNFWGTPVTGASTPVLGNRPNYYNPLYATDPNTVAGLQAGWVPYSGGMTQGVGYISKGGGTVSFTGTVSSLNTGPTISVPVVKNANGVAFNVVGNPFPSAISAVEFLETNGPSGAPYFGNNTITGSLYFWDDDASNGSGYSQSDFAVWSGAGGVGPNSGTTFNGNISSGQGFSVEKISTDITPPNDAVRFTNSMRTTTNNIFFRQAPIERLWVSVTNPGGLYNEVLVAFLDDATDGYDAAYDAKKFKGNDNIALYTKLSGADYAIQALAPLAADKTVALGFDAGVAGSHTLRLKTIENLDETVTVILEDTETGTFQNLRLNDTYTFTALAGKHENRFILYFNPAMQVEAGEATCAGNDATLTFQQAGSKLWNYMLKNSAGLVIERRAGFSGTNVFTDLSPGSYTLTLTDDYGYQTTKTIELNGKALVNADFTASTNSVNVYEEISFGNLSTGASQYHWNFGDGSAISADENPAHIYTIPGVYEVMLTSLNDDCEAQKSSSVEVEEIATGLSNASGENIFRAYTQDKNIYAVFDFIREQPAQLTVYDVLGRTIYNQQVTTSGVKTIREEHLASGCLFIRLNTGSEVFTQKIFIGR